MPKIVKGGEYSAPVHYFLNGAEEIAESLCKSLNRDPQEPYAIFNPSGDPFSYCEGKDGVACDKQKLLNDISASLNGNFERVHICTSVVKCNYSMGDIVERTQKLCSFTTYFDAENTDRSDNIRLAAEKINGTVIEAGGEFSFNGTVGARTEENGFKPAKIIENGKFVTGYGGGVCQVSTTLYNAAVLSGLEITEYHPHSLQVSYVSPSRDAMVSGSYFDLKFKNNRLTPIYVRVNCTLNSVKCTVYGQSDGFDYSIVSKVTGTVARPPAVVEDGIEDGDSTVVTYGRDGTLSEGYLVKRRGGEEFSTLLRKDKYAAVADVIRKNVQTDEEREDTQEDTQQ
ncbi:MAG: VanW family protein [Clostridia bacterium]|nr:VanW family protein [Clostridia bacterium]